MVVRYISAQRLTIAPGDLVDMRRHLLLESGYGVKIGQYAKTSSSGRCAAKKRVERG